MTEQANFVCCFCAKCFKSGHGLKEHEKTHKDPQFKCDVCEKAFFFRDGINQHMATHTDTAKYTCEQCGVYFSRRSSYHQHTRKHLPEKQFNCRHCEKKFLQKIHLTAHEKTHGEKSQCDKCMKSVFHLENHLKLCGTSEHAECSICGRSFKRPRYLAEHRRNVHEDPERFNCDNCGHRYTYRASLFNHKKKCIK